MASKQRHGDTDGGKRRCLTLLRCEHEDGEQENGGAYDLDEETLNHVDAFSQLVLYEQWSGGEAEYEGRGDDCANELRYHVEGESPSADLADESQRETDGRIKQPASRSIEHPRTPKKCNTGSRGDVYIMVDRVRSIFCDLETLGGDDGELCRLDGAQGEK